MASTHSIPCPCGQSADYARCCGPLHAGTALATTAEQLMRSRYSAYVLRRADYLLATWHASTRPAGLDVEGDATAWLGLRVLRHGAEGPDRALVEFVARYRVGGASAQRLHEVSRFRREDGRWFYVDGEFPDEA